MARLPDVLATSLSVGLAAAGVLHLARPRVFESLIPPALGSPRPWVVGSGVAELACAAAVAVPTTRRAGGYATAALFVGVFPGNVQMALNSRENARHWSQNRAIAWGRLPGQVPLVLWALRVARTAPARTTAVGA
ncbi:DoxX family protein [Paraoerskovia marina]|uniref:DoxX family protein n=1 Tax=Paraoerskovia marina TaxID=545619 RepID=UPI0004923EB4|nr:DoxX family protein [Paraoerskovia marina]